MKAGFDRRSPVLQRRGAACVRWLIAACLLAPAAAWPGQMAAVPAELWELPRTARAVLAQPVLREHVAALLASGDAALAIHYGGGEEALLRAEELRAWLIALAVDDKQIMLAGDLPGAGELRIELITNRGQQ